MKQRNCDSSKQVMCEVWFTGKGKLLVVKGQATADPKGHYEAQASHRG